MEAMVPSTPHVQLPPGFRFHPSDEELILHYLQNKATSTPLPATIIAEIELYKFNPWELPSRALFGEEEWYFFTPRDRKYPNGVRPNRMAASGFWKATGSDRPILASSRGTIVGVKKALVFYEGKPPRGIKTGWIMHEYRLLDTMPWTNASSKRNGSMRLDDWVLCRVRQKCSTPRSICEDRYGKNNNALDNFPRADHKPISSTNPNHDIELLKSTLFKDCPMLPFIFSSDQLDLSSMDTFSSTVSYEGSKASTNSISQVSSEENLQVYFPSFDYLKSTRKRKAEEATDFIQLSKKIHEPKEKAIYLSNDTIEMSFNGGYQSDQWNYTTENQDLTRIAFT